MINKMESNPKGTFIIYFQNFYGYNWQKDEYKRIIYGCKVL